MNAFRDWIDVIFKVVLATVGVYVGYYFSIEKQQNEDVKVVIELASSQEETKRYMAFAIAQEYRNQHRIPESIHNALVVFFNRKGEDPTLQREVNEGVARLAMKDPRLQQTVALASDDSRLPKADSELPVRIYFQIKQNTDRKEADAIRSKIQSKTTPEGARIIIPGIELVPGSQQSKSQLKCFKLSECKFLGPQLVRIFKQENVDINLLDLSRTYENSTSIRPKHFEAWFVSPLKSEP
jgi:hypothetical protein